jgi:hypothetical protein
MQGNDQNGAAAFGWLVLFLGYGRYSGYLNGKAGHYMPWHSDNFACEGGNRAFLG